MDSVISVQTESSLQLSYKHLSQLVLPFFLSFASVVLRL